MDPTEPKKIKFKQGASSPFFTSLNLAVNELLSSGQALEKAKRLLWFKLFFYSSIHFSGYVFLFAYEHQHFITFLLNYVWIGVSGIFLAFNVSHDACHDTFSRNKKVNHFIYHLSFNLQGTNAYLWKIRHIASHHLFPNVDGCDADIDDNPLIRLSPQHPHRKHQRYQHIYAILIYSIYTLHWYLIKDFNYLNKERVANLSKKEHKTGDVLLLYGWKLLYLFILIIYPLMAGYSFKWIIISFLIMHVANSWIFIHFLITTHLCLETDFPKPDQDGYLPTDYYVHQLTTSLDYSPTSKLYNFLFGGFNAHAAHHLYPKLPHTIYPLISGLIKRKAHEFNVPYNESTLLRSIGSHYKYLKKMGTPVQP